MNAARASKSASKAIPQSAEPPFRTIVVRACIIAFLWALTTSAISSRLHLVMGYRVISLGHPVLEPLLSSNLGGGFAFGMAAIWLGWLVRLGRQTPELAAHASWQMLAALVPLLFSISRLFFENEPPALYWEPLWLATWTGVSFATLASAQVRSDHGLLSVRYSAGLAVGLAAVCAVWWYLQTDWYYRHYLLGFNDFGHFSQRIANTVAGRGWLLESPVLPMFWDHFNPGLLLLTPLWKIAPTVHLVFWIQSICLAGSSLLIWCIARRLGHSPAASTVWSAAWLAQPALGQMNLAYTYGWHPVSIAIPFLLLALLNLLQGARWRAALAALVAMSMEEGVIVVVCLFGATCAVLDRFKSEDVELQELLSRVMRMTAVPGMLVSLAAGLGFCIVYYFSGLSEFQTGRFVALGDNAFEIVLSPVLRPSAFWGELLRPEKAAYLLSLLLPCFAIALRRGWYWLLAAAFPLGVLLVWDHRPAACLGFQYASALLPISWLSALWGARHLRGAASGALATGLTLSLFVGQLPYSSASIADVVGQTYGAEQETSRGPSTKLGQWLNEHVDAIRRDGEPVLATGRIAAHLVGNRDVETVGQYVMRREQLAQLPDRLGDPIRRYRWILLDRQERLQQSEAEVISVEAEARQRGFVEVASLESLIVLRQTAP